MISENKVSTHYANSKLTQAIKKGLASLGLDENSVTINDLAPVDEFHIGGREGTKIFSTNDEEIGTITSGTFGPSVNAPVAMGYIDQKFSEIGANIKLEVRGKKHNAQVSKLPFYKKSYVK